MPVGQVLQRAERCQGKTQHKIQDPPSTPRRETPHAGVIHPPSLDNVTAHRKEHQDAQGRDRVIQIAIWRLPHSDEGLPQERRRTCIITLRRDAPCISQLALERFAFRNAILRSHDD